MSAHAQSPLMQVRRFLSLFEALRRHHPATFAHSERVASASAAFSRFLGLANPEIFYLGGLCHDVGKLKAPVAILDKAGALDPYEREIIDRHGPAGARLLDGLGLPSEVLAAARHHHERWDGMGVPDGLVGKQIPLVARVVALADAFVAMTEDRPYRPRGAMSFEDALGCIASRSGSQFDPALCLAFVAMLTRQAADTPVVIQTFAVSTQ